MIIYAKLGFVSSYNDNMIYIDTGHHSGRSCDRRHCACLVNLTKVSRSTLYSSVHTHGERNQYVYNMHNMDESRICGKAEFNAIFLRLRWKLEDFDQMAGWGPV